MIRTFFISALMTGVREPAGSIARTIPCAPTCVTGVSRDVAIDDGRCAETTAAAHRLQPIAGVTPLQLVQQRGHQARPGRAERVAEGDRAAVDVHPLHVRVMLV